MVSPDDEAYSRYSKAAKKMLSEKRRNKRAKKVGMVMGEFKRGTLYSGSGQKVKSRAQAVAIGMSEQRKHGGY